MKIKTGLFGKEVEISLEELRQLALDEVVQVGYLKATGQLNVLEPNISRRNSKPTTQSIKGLEQEE